MRIIEIDSWLINQSSESGPLDDATVDLIALELHRRTSDQGVPPRRAPAATSGVVLDPLHMTGANDSAGFVGG